MTNKLTDFGKVFVIGIAFLLPVMIFLGITGKVSIGNLIIIWFSLMMILQFGFALNKLIKNVNANRIEDGKSSILVLIILIPFGIAWRLLCTIAQIPIDFKYWMKAVDFNQRLTELEFDLLSFNQDERVLLREDMKATCRKYDSVHVFSHYPRGGTMKGSITKDFVEKRLEIIYDRLINQLDDYLTLKDMLKYGNEESGLSHTDLWKMLGFDPISENTFVLYFTEEDEYDRGMKYLEPWIDPNSLRQKTHFPMYYLFNLNPRGITHTPLRLSGSTGKRYRKQIAEATNAGRSLKIDHLDTLFIKHRGTLVAASTGIL